MSKQHERTERLRTKFPRTTGIYRRPNAGEVPPHLSLEDMLALTDALAEQILACAGSSLEARANAGDGKRWVRQVRRLLDRPLSPARMSEWACLIAIYAMSAGMIAERLYVRSKEDYALHGRDMEASRSRGGAATADARREQARDWRSKAQAEADEVWRRHPDWSKSQVAKVISGNVGIAAGTIRQEIRKKIAQRQE